MFAGDTPAATEISSSKSPSGSVNRITSSPNRADVCSRRDVVLLKALQPITERVGRNRERGRFDLAGPAASAARARPRKECENRSRRAAVVAEIEMIASRIVKIHSAFNETQTEKSHVKIEVPLRIAGNRSNVMKSANFVFHQTTMSDLVVQLVATRGSGWNRIAATIASRAETRRTMSCVSLNGGSVCVGASACNAGIFSNACTTNTNKLK